MRGINKVNDTDKPDKKYISYEAYEKLADAYAAQIDTKPHNAYLERPATLSLIPDVEGKKVLDAGCGSGSYTEFFIKNGAEVVAVDGSLRMLENARKRLGERADIRLHDLREPLNLLKDGSMDLVFSSLVLDYIEDWVPVLREFRRVLKGDGALVFSVGHPASWPFLKIDVKDYFRVEKTEMTWKTWGVPVVMPSYRRPLQNITESLHRAGFIIERMIEAQPTEDYKRADPESYERLRVRPSFINVKAIPRIGT